MLVMTKRDKALTEYAKSNSTGFPPVAPTEVWITDDGRSTLQIAMDWSQPWVMGPWGTNSEPVQYSGYRTYLPVRDRADAISKVVALMASGARLRHSIPTQEEINLWMGAWD